MRLRTIKPGFFKNEDLGEIAPLGRILFAGLWCMADREGRLEDRPKRIKAEVLPYDECDADGLLKDLADKEFILRYEVGGDRFIQVLEFTKHQQPHYKEEGSKIPPPQGHEDSGYIAFGVSESKRQEIFDRDGRKCLECGATERLSLDHIIPRSKGGTNDDDNLKTLCVSCNARKRNRDAASSSQGQVNVNAASPSVLGLPSSDIGVLSSGNPLSLSETSPLEGDSPSPFKGEGDPDVWPEWYSMLWGVEGFKATYGASEKWRAAHDISEEVALDKAYALRDWWPRQAPRRRKEGNPYSTWQHWCREAAKTGRAPPGKNGTGYYGFADEAAYNEGLKRAAAERNGDDELP